MPSSAMSTCPSGGGNRLNVPKSYGHLENDHSINQGETMKRLLVMLFAMLVLGAVAAPAYASAVANGLHRGL